MKTRRILMPIVLFLGLVACSPKQPATVTPFSPPEFSPTITSLAPTTEPSQTATLIPTPTTPKTVAPTPTRPPQLTPTPTKVVVTAQALASLPVGNYAVYWRNALWYIRNIDGSIDTPFLPVASHHSYLVPSPNSQRVALIDDQDRLAVYDLTAQQLIVCEDATVKLRLIQWAPDSTRVAYIDTKNQVTVCDVASRQVTRYPSVDSIHSKAITALKWSPDGQVLMYTGYPGNDVYRDGEASMAMPTYFMIGLSAKTTWVAGGNGGMIGPRWSQDGKSVYYFTVEDDAVGYRVPSACFESPAGCGEAESERIDLPMGWLSENTMRMTCPNDPNAICVQDTAANSTPTLLAKIDRLPECPSLSEAQKPNLPYTSLSVPYVSPDLQHVVLQARCASIEHVIFMNDLFLASAQSNVTNVTKTDTESEYFDAWSPDGHSFAYTMRVIQDALPNLTSDLVDMDTYLSQSFIVSADGAHKIDLSGGSGEKTRFAFWWRQSAPLEIGGDYVITAEGAGLKLRAGASQYDAVVKVLWPGDVITVLEGPFDAEGYRWWRVRDAAGDEGWLVGVPGWYEPAALVP